MKRLPTCWLAFVVVMAAKGHEFTDEEKAWWAVQPIKEVPVPERAVDYFVGRKLDEAELKMAPKASAEEFVRRAYFDLHGLPPSVEEAREFVKAFEMDEDAAVIGLIDALLESPRYGERWGQHWLDVVRYADSDGYRADDFRPTAFWYRDYVIRAFNEDKSYDDFVREQLAGDEIAPGDPEGLAATGFLRHGVYEYNQRNAEMQREIMINEITNVTGEVFLGMGIGCAQCHDHKFDPILQKDYFALQAFLSSVYWPDDRYHATSEEIAKHEEDRREWEDATVEIRAEMNSLMEAGEKKIYNSQVKTFPPKVQEMFAEPWKEKSSYARQISFLVDRQALRIVRTLATVEKVLAKDSAERARHDELARDLAGFDHLKPKELPRAFMSTDTGSEAAVVSLKDRELEPQFLELLGGEKPKIEVRQFTTGRRSALADWIVREDNPFTSRVMVNRIWQHHFGKGLAASPNDFGMLGEKPTHPVLLDWLAGEFVKGGWKVKRMHRLIMTSAAYRQTARFEPSNTHNFIDPENKLLWRFPPRRLSAEQIRDAMLAVSGELKHREGGAAQGSSASGRSIYLKKMRNTPDRILQCFDSPSGFSSEPERLNTTTPTQSLLLANSEWPLGRARVMANRVLGHRESASAEDVARAYEMAWGREATEDEVKAAMDFLAVQKALPGESLKKEGRMVELGNSFQGAEGFLKEDTVGAFFLAEGGALELSGVGLKDDHFTVSAVARLDRIHADGRVNTLVSQWNGNQQDSGWAMGVTSAKSRYEPRNFIVQLVGRNPSGDMKYEVVASGLRVPLEVPVFLAVSIDPQPNGKGTVTFYLKNLSHPDHPMEMAKVAHTIVGGILPESGQALVGGRLGGAHFWHGIVGRVTVVPKRLKGDEVMNAAGALVDVGASDFSEFPEGVKWNEMKEASQAPTHEAFSDFCHALLSSNEFLYLH
jgi:hypothetical protein